MLEVGLQLQHYLLPDGKPTPYGRALALGSGTAIEQHYEEVCLFIKRARRVCK